MAGCWRLRWRAAGIEANGNAGKNDRSGNGAEETEDTRPQPVGRRVSGCQGYPENKEPHPGTGVGLSNFVLVRKRIAPRHSAGGCHVRLTSRLSGFSPRNHCAFGGSSFGSRQTLSKSPGFGTYGFQTPGKKTHRWMTPAMMVMTISGAGAGSGVFSVFGTVSFRQGCGR